MIRYEVLTKEHKDVEEVRKFYDYSFPDDERMPYDRLLSMVDTNHRMYVWYDEDKLIGMTFSFVYDHLAYLSYICIRREEQDHGYGSKILQVLEDVHPRIVADIERIKTEQDEEQIRRKQFYMRNHFHETGVFYYIYNVDYELLSTGKSVTGKEWNDLIHAFWGKFADTAVISEKPLMLKEEKAV